MGPTIWREIKMDLDLHLPEWERLPLEGLDNGLEGAKLGAFDVDLCEGWLIWILKTSTATDGARGAGMNGRRRGETRKEGSSGARGTPEGRKAMSKTSHTFQISINSCPSSFMIPCSEYCFGFTSWLSTAPILYGKKCARGFTSVSPRSSGPHWLTEKSKPGVRTSILE
jgi:hypothetical protein